MAKGRQHKRGLQKLPKQPPIGQETSLGRQWDDQEEDVRQPIVCNVDNLLTTQPGVNLARERGDVADTAAAKRVSSLISGMGPTATHGIVEIAQELKEGKTLKIQSTTADGTLGKTRVITADTTTMEWFRLRAIDPRYPCYVYIPDLDRPLCEGFRIIKELRIIMNQIQAECKLQNISLQTMQFNNYRTEAFCQTPWQIWNICTTVIVTSSILGSMMQQQHVAPGTAVLVLSGAKIQEVWQTMLALKRRFPQILRFVLIGGVNNFLKMHSTLGNTVSPQEYHMAKAINEISYYVKNLPMPGNADVFMSVPLKLGDLRRGQRIMELSERLEAVLKSFTRARLYIVVPPRAIYHPNVYEVHAETHKSPTLLVNLDSGVRRLTRRKHMPLVKDISAAGVVAYVVSTADSNIVDLPLDQRVVDGSYNNTSREKLANQSSQREVVAAKLHNRDYPAPPTGYKNGPKPASTPSSAGNPAIFRRFEEYQQMVEKAKLRIEQVKDEFARESTYMKHRHPEFDKLAKFLPFLEWAIRPDTEMEKKFPMAMGIVSLVKQIFWCCREDETRAWTIMQQPMRHWNEGMIDCSVGDTNFEPKHIIRLSPAFLRYDHERFEARKAARVAARKVGYPKLTDEQKIDLGCVLFEELSLAQFLVVLQKEGYAKFERGPASIMTDVNNKKVHERYDEFATVGAAMSLTQVQYFYGMDYKSKQHEQLKKLNRVKTMDATAMIHAMTGRVPLMIEVVIAGSFSSVQELEQMLDYQTKVAIFGTAVQQPSIMFPEWVDAIPQMRHPSRYLARGQFRKFFSVYEFVLHNRHLIEPTTTVTILPGGTHKEGSLLLRTLMSLVPLREITGETDDELMLEAAVLTPKGDRVIIRREYDHPQIMKAIDAADRGEAAALALKNAPSPAMDEERPSTSQGLFDIAEVEEDGDELLTGRIRKFRRCSEPSTASDDFTPDFLDRSFSAPPPATGNGVQICMYCHRPSYPFSGTCNCDATMRRGALQIVLNDKVDTDEEISPISGKMLSLRASEATEALYYYFDVSGFFDDVANCKFYALDVNSWPTAIRYDQDRLVAQLDHLVKLGLTPDVRTRLCDAGVHSDKFAVELLVRETDTLREILREECIPTFGAPYIAQRELTTTEFTRITAILTTQVETSVTEEMQKAHEEIRDAFITMNSNPQACFICSPRYIEDNIATIVEALCNSLENHPDLLILFKNSSLAKANAYRISDNPKYLCTSDMARQFEEMIYEKSVELACTNPIEPRHLMLVVAGAENVFLPLGLQPSVGVIDILRLPICVLASLDPIGYLTGAPEYPPGREMVRQVEISLETLHAIMVKRDVEYHTRAHATSDLHLNIAERTVFIAEIFNVARKDQIKFRERIYQRPMINGNNAAWKYYSTKMFALNLPRYPTSGAATAAEHGIYVHYWANTLCPKFCGHNTTEEPMDMEHTAETPATQGEHRDAAGPSRDL
jgi:hypothetical protein